MPDITMCVSEECPIRKTCYRHEATPSGWQIYADFLTERAVQEGCDNYIRLHWREENPDDDEG